MLKKPMLAGEAAAASISPLSSAAIISSSKPNGIVFTPRRFRIMWVIEPDMTPTRCSPFRSRGVAIPGASERIASSTPPC